MKKLEFTFNEEETKLKKNKLNIENKENYKIYDISFPINISDEELVNIYMKSVQIPLLKRFNCMITHSSKIGASWIVQTDCDDEKNTLAAFEFLNEEFQRLFASRFTEENHSTYEDTKSPSSFANSYRGRRRNGR